MKRYFGTTFVSKELINSCKVTGNPAVVYILDNNENFDSNVMADLCQKEKAPMTCFVKKKNNYDYDISFWYGHGVHAYMCGHGSLITANILSKLCSTNKVNIYFDISHYKTKIKDNLLKFVIDEDLVLLETSIYNFNVVENQNFNQDMLDLLNLMDLKINDVEEAIAGVELKDLFFVIKDNMKARKLNIQFEKIAPYLIKMNIRNLCTTAKSNFDNFDFETRVFCPHDGLDEDTACGSSNLSIANYWSKKLNRNNFKVLFPYHMEYNDKLVGGIQIVNIKNDKILIGGFCE